jgi:hypothetical protein
MEKIDQLHETAALPLCEKALVSVKQEDGCVLEPV